jgi:hypothetical protein
MDIKQSAGDKPKSTRSGRTPILRPLGLSVGVMGVPAAVWLANPAIGTVMWIVEALVVLTVAASALFGSKTVSDRAFRLLRWVADRPEHEGPSGDSNLANLASAR